MNRREFLKTTGLATAGIGLAGLAEPTPASASGSCLWGAYAGPRSRSQTLQEAITGLELKIGRRLGITRHYVNWEAKLPTKLDVWTVQHGHSPYISWHTEATGGGGVTFSSIAHGQHDRAIKDQAHRLRRWGRHVYFSFNHEPENDRWAGGPAEFKAAWYHMRRLFHEVGANNITWIVVLMASTYAGGHGGPKRWLPDHYDLLGVDGYNRYPCLDNRSKHPWVSFRTLFNPAYRLAQEKSKGLFIGEYATVEQDSCGNTGGDPRAKAEWIADASATIRSWPQVKAALYSHTEAHFEGYREGYWVDSSNASLQAFKSAGQLPYFR